MAVTNSLVSIIMPSFNAEFCIEDAIISVINQTYENWELIIVNDGSTDQTENVVKKWLLQDQRIQYFYQENGKQGKARNLGISKSRGQYLAFLDADDIWLNEKLSIQVNEIQTKNVDLVFSDSYIFNDNDIQDTSQKMNIPTNILFDENSVKVFLKGNRIPILTVLVDKSKVENVGGFAETIDIQNVEDYHLWLKLLMSGCKFYALDYVLAKYRVHKNAATSADKAAHSKVPNAFFDLFQNYPAFRKEIKLALKIKFIHIYRTNIFSKSELSSWINKNTEYLGKSTVKYFYEALNFFLPTKATKRILIYVLNA